MFVYWLLWNEEKAAAWNASEMTEKFKMRGRKAKQFLLFKNEENCDFEVIVLWWLSV